MRHLSCPESQLVTRRAAFVGVMAGTLASALGCKSAHVAIARPGSDTAALYAYPGTRPDTTVLAVRWPGAVSAFEVTRTRVHVDADTWQVSQAHNYVSFEVASERFAGGRRIWAERLGPGGARQRVGSGFLDTLLASRVGLAELYHSLSPEQDVNALTPIVTAAYRRRLATALLPDVLYYDSTAPAGFTFAARNGRHPRDEHSSVVAAILAKEI